MVHTASAPHLHILPLVIDSDKNPKPPTNPCASSQTCQAGLRVGTPLYTLHVQGQNPCVPTLWASRIPTCRLLMSRIFPPPTRPIFETPLLHKEHPLGRHLRQRLPEGSLQPPTVRRRGAAHQLGVRRPGAKRKRQGQREEEPHRTDGFHERDDPLVIVLLHLCFDLIGGLVLRCGELV